MKCIQYITLAGCMLAIQACTRGFEDLNVNKAGFNSLDAQYQLTKVQADMSGDREDVWRYDLGITSPLVQHLGGSWWTQHGGMYKIVDKTHWYSHWETTYPRELKNLEDMIDKTADDPAKANMHAAARIVRVMVYSKLTDLYGDIPYTEAGRGFTDKNFMPKYDKQEDIYKDLFKELDEAFNELDASGPAISGDIWFNGSVAKWRKLASSMRLRLGFRLTRRDLTEAKKQVEAAISGGVMTELADICMTRHEAFSWVSGSGDSRGNGRSQVFKSEPRSGGFRLVKTLVDTMVKYQDPRLYIYGGTYFGNKIIGDPTLLDISGLMPAIGVSPGAMAWNEWGEYGNVNLPGGGSVWVGQDDRFVQPSKYVSALNAPFFHVTPAEVEYLLAEAALRGWGGVTDAEGHFKKGLQFACEAMQFYPGAPAIQQTAIDNFKNKFNPFPTIFDSAMSRVHTQMWVNFFLNGTEAYANWRRTGLPDLKRFKGVDWYSPGADTMPRRFFYPESEILLNPKNYQEAIGRMNNTNDMMTPVWWDKQ